MNSLNFEKFNKPILTKNLIIFILIIYFCWLFKTYSGNFHSVYLHMWKYTSGAFSFENDIDWWVTVPLSRDSTASNLFHYICVLKTLEKASKKIKKILIKVNSKFLSNLIRFPLLVTPIFL